MISGWFHRRDKIAGKASIPFPTQIILTKGTNRTKYKYTKKTTYIPHTHQCMFNNYIYQTTTFTPWIHTGWQSSYIQYYSIFSL